MMQEPNRNLLSGHYAGFTSRALAFVVDVAIIGATLIGISWLISVTATLFQIRQILEFLLNAISVSDEILERFFGPTMMSILAGIYLLAYQMFFMILVGQTPGKALMGLRVVRMDGKRPNAWHAFLRVIGYFISALPLYLGYFWVFIDDRRQAWQDKLAGTCVIYTWAARPDERFLTMENKQFSGSGTSGINLEIKNK